MRRSKQLEEPTAAELALIARRQADEAAAKRARRQPRRAGGRGWRGAGRGAAGYVPIPEQWRGTSVQVCGLWPFAAGTGSPMSGVPVGRNLLTGGTLCCDPISWFQHARLISNPSMFVQAIPGIGKSTLVGRMALGLAGYGVNPMVFGDLRPDYVDLIRAMGGQVIELGRGRGSLNVLDPGETMQAAERLTGKARTRLLADAHGRRLTMVGALITIMRGQPPADYEETIVDRALRILDERHGADSVPTLPDLLRVVQEAPDELRQAALDRGDMKEYWRVTRALEATLVGLVDGGRFGDIFNQPTTVAMKRDRPVVFDVSSIDDNEQDLQAAVLLACWSNGFGAINAAQELADAGKEPRRHYFVVLDELWRALRAGRGMVDRVDALTRLNRQRGVGLAMVTHTMSDLMSMPDEHDKMKAKGFVERSGMVICGGLPQAEMPLLNSAVRLSRAEEQMLVSWSAPPSWDSAGGADAEPPGRGRFLVKVGGRPGIPFQVGLTATERLVSDTNRRWRVDVEQEG